MRMTALAVVLVLSASGPAAAQEWDVYTSIPDGFAINFPGEPTITESVWSTQFDYKVPARTYEASLGSGHFSVMVADYSNLEQLAIERAKTCPPGNAQCRANAGDAIGTGYYLMDIRGAIMFATFKLIQEAAQLTELAWEWIDMVEGNLLQYTNADESRTYAFVTMHRNKLYILKGTVPKGYPEPGLFYQSLDWRAENGDDIRYQIIYSNSYHGLGVYPVPPGNRGGGGGGGGGRQGGGRQGGAGGQN